jgi:hypothetical protein
MSDDRHNALYETEVFKGLPETEQARIRAERDGQQRPTVAKGLVVNPMTVVVAGDGSVLLVQKRLTIEAVQAELGGEYKVHIVSAMPDILQVPIDVVISVCYRENEESPVNPGLARVLTGFPPLRGKVVLACGYPAE